MWTLFVVTILPYIDDAKVVRYGEYATQKHCYYEMFQLENELNSGEEVMCVRTDEPKPVNDNKK